jgi:hypothetical protein
VNSFFRTDDDLDPAQIAAYLRTHGWRVADRRRTTSRWTLPDEGRSIVLVDNREDPDYEDYLSVLFARLRDIERRDSEAILGDIRVAGRDTLVLRVAAPAISAGEIPISYGTELFGGVRDLLVASGRSLDDTRANFRGPTPESVMNLLDRLTFGETQAGSYILTVRTPVDQQLAFDAIASGANIERRTIARTIEAVSAARDAGTRLNDEDALDMSIEHGLSAQLCKALTRIDPETTGVAVEFSTQWADGLPDPAPNLPRTIALESADFAHVRYLGETLSRIIPDNDFSLDGWIKEIKFDALWAARGIVTVEARVRGRRRDVRVELEGSDFEESRRLAGRGYLRAVGTLEKAGRTWVLTSPKHVQFAEGAPPA